MRTKRRMKKMVLWLSLLLPFLFSCGCSPRDFSATFLGQTTEPQETSPATPTLLEEIKERGYILIGSSNDAPFSYQDPETGELAGIDIEILKEINRRLGIPDIQMRVIEFPNLLIALNDSEIDMVVDGMYVRDDRLILAAFTDKWYQEGEAVVLRSDSAIQSKEDLVGKTVGAQPGTAFYEVASQWLAEGRIGALIPYDSQSALLTALQLDPGLDAIITDGIVASYALATDRSLDLKILTPYVQEATGQIAAAVRFRNRNFLNEVNRTLREMKEDGTLLAILESQGLSADYYVGLEEGRTVNFQ